MAKQDGSVPALDIELCERARISRDRRYDGVFFTAVRTTGTTVSRSVLYIRRGPGTSPSSGPPPRPSRPASGPACAAVLKPRPKVRPGSAPRRRLSVACGWLIEAGFFDNGTVAQLAERLGVGARHLCRLFIRHVGAGPSAVASTRRVQAAKRLIDQSAMSLAEIAFTAGFGSVRRFNTAFL